MVEHMLMPGPGCRGVNDIGMELESFCASLSRVVVNRIIQVGNVNVMGLILARYGKPEVIIFLSAAQDEAGVVELKPKVL